MKCAIHPDRDASGYCRTCGKPLCTECVRDVRGILYCEPCLAAMVSAAPAPARTAAEINAPNPGVAGALGIIPGLGAIYNGEYAKGLIHIAVFAGIIAIMNAQTSDSLQIFFGIGLACFICYMPLEAYRTAKLKRTAAYAAYAPSAAVTAASGEGAPSASFAGVAAPAPQQQPQASFHASPASAVVLIVLGVLILLANLGLLSGNWLGHWWPLILIGLGVWLFWKRFHEPAGRGTGQP